MVGCMAKIAAIAAITGEDNPNKVLAYKASVTATPVFIIRAPNVTSIFPASSSTFPFFEAKF